MIDRGQSEGKDVGRFRISVKEKVLNVTALGPCEHNGANGARSVNELEQSEEEGIRENERGIRLDNGG